MTIAVIGPPAAGKTRIGRALARRVGKPFVDTDARIVQQHGPIPQIFAEHGEAVFREFERAAVREAFATDGVVSLGGGAVLDPVSRELVRTARVVMLNITEEAVASRIANDKRPLITGIESWRTLVAARADHYAELADVVFDTSTRSSAAIVADIACWLEENP